MTVVLKLYPEIINRMVAVAAAESDLTDFAPGSVSRSTLEAAALQDADQYVQIAQIESLFSIDTATGSDLDERGADYVGIVPPRLTAMQSAGFVNIGDTRVTTKESGTLSASILSGVTTAVVILDSGVVYTGFPASGNLILDRGNGLRELVPYSSFTGTGPLTFTFSSATAFAHQAGATAILSQQGSDSTIRDQTIVYAAATASSAEIDCTIQGDTILFDGDAIVVAPVQSQLPGSIMNAAAGLVTNFQSPPFPTATVINPAGLAGGTDPETDDAYRSRIKTTVATLPRSTVQAIEFAASQVSLPTGERVVTAQLLEPVIPGAPSVLYIDDGTGATPQVVTQVAGPEIVIQLAQANQSRGQLDNWPIVSGTVRLFRSVASGIQPSGVPSITVSGSTFTDPSQVFTTAFNGMFLFDPNGNQFTISGAAGGHTLTLTGVLGGAVNAVQPIASQNYFIVDPTSPIPSTQVVFNYSTGAIQMPGSVPYPGASPIPGVGLSTVNGNKAEGIVALQTVSGPAAPAYEYYGGLIQAVQQVLNGLPSNLVNFPGVKGSGATIIITTPNVLNVVITIGISAPAGVSADTLEAPVQAAIVAYINALSIGESVIVAQIIAAAVAAGASDAQMVAPTSNIVVSEGYLARTTLALVTVT